MKMKKILIFIIILNILLIMENIYIKKNKKYNYIIVYNNIENNLNINLPKNVKLILGNFESNAWKMWEYVLNNNNNNKNMIIIV